MNFLKNKFELHASREAGVAAERTKIRAALSPEDANRLETNADVRIQNYLDRLMRLVLDADGKQGRRSMGDKQATSRPRAVSLLRELVMNKYVRPSKDKMARSAAAVEERAARQLGIGMRYGEAELEQRGEVALADAESSLDQWISYLSDPDEPYPDWFRYYVFRSVLDLSDYDKDKGEFPRRSAGTIRLFPEIDRGALGFVRDVIEAADDPTMLQRLIALQRENGTLADQLWTQKKAKQFAQLSFAKQYAEGLKQNGEITPELRAETRGSWVRYPQGSDPTPLWASLQNKGTAWCTKGFGTAQTQLEGGDFYVYYTLDQLGQPTIPRIAILMQNNEIFEVRGVADTKQNLEGNMSEIAAVKMRELPGAEKYQKASADMRQLTAIENKVKTNQELTRDELVFLYEIDAQISGFGFERDPRISELRKTRDFEADMPIAFDCTPEQIARNPEKITGKTKAYVGPLTPGIFQQLRSVEHIYTAFPEKKIRKIELELPGMTGEEWIAELESLGIKINDKARLMLRSPEFANRAVKRSVIDRLLGRKNISAVKKEAANLIRLTVADLGFPNDATTKDIYAKAEELKLELCPAEVGPVLRKQYTNQPLKKLLCIGMKQVTSSNGNSFVFGLSRFDSGFWLVASFAGVASKWNPDEELVFRLPAA